MEINVKTGKLNEYAETEEKVKKALVRINNSIQLCKSQLRTCISSSSSEMIDTVLANIISQTQVMYEKIGSMSAALYTIANLYNQAEGEITGNTPSEEMHYGRDFFGEIIGEFGVTGAIGSLAFKERDVISVSKAVTKSIGKVSGAVEEGKEWWSSKALFGFEKEVAEKAVKKEVKKVAEKAVKEEVKKKTFKEALKDEVADYRFDSEKIGKSATANKGKVIAKWAGAVLTVADKAKGNYEEYKEQGGIKNSRFWGETVTESVVEIGKDIVIGAAVAATIGGAIATMPAWAGVAVTATITAGVSVALDAVSNKVTKNTAGFTENVSDFVVDKVESFVGNAVSFVKKPFARWATIV